jgi:Aldehyde:ferredoxin oxidoreductase
MGGYTGKILRINLTEGKTGIESLNMELARKYLSGRGLAGKMFFDEVAADVKAFAPENKIYIAAGVLTGTNAPASGRFTVVTKSPLNGAISSSNSGGYWGVQLKFAGYDMVILEGKAAYPVYISIKDDLVEIKDASQLWGKDVYAATEALKLEFGDPMAKVMTIGPAGENLSLMAVFMNDLNRAAGRSGVGAVMGSKNLKAIIVRGTGKIENANICYRCPIDCGHQKKWEDGENTRSKRKIKSSFASDCGIHDYEAIHVANDLCNKLGLDSISVGCTIATGMELVQRGFIKPEELDGTLLEFGNIEGIREWIRKIAHAQGLGAKMAQGAYHFAESYGHPELSMTVKRLEVPASDYRVIQGQSLQFATGNQGGGHDRGYKAVSPEILGFSQLIDKDSIKGKSMWVKILQDLTAVIDSLGMCLFTSAALGLSDYTAIVNAVTGFDYTDVELLACGDRIWNIERLHNLRTGMTTADDTLPESLLKIEIPVGSSKGSIHRLQELLPAYYTERGWDEAGVPTPECLKKLRI